MPFSKRHEPATRKVLTECGVLGLRPAGGRHDTGVLAFSVTSDCFRGAKRGGSGLSRVPMLGRGNGRPSRPEVERVALDLLRRRGPEVLATARRYSTTAEDAEDAYQRALEILITKARTTAEDALVT